jgi:hypothetical protein
MLLKAVAFDWGHTVVDENRDVDIPLDVRPVHLMPGVSEVLPRIALPLALWAYASRERVWRAHVAEARRSRSCFSVGHDLGRCRCA